MNYHIKDSELAEETQLTARQLFLLVSPETAAAIINDIDYPIKSDVLPELGMAMNIGCWTEDEKLRYRTNIKL